MDARVNEGPAQAVWAREQAFLTQTDAVADLFAPDFVSFDTKGDALDGAEFADLVQTQGAQADAVELMWCEQGAPDSLCLAFKMPNQNGHVSTHLSLWRQTGPNWQKQFHIFVEGEDSLQKSAPTG